MWRIMGEYAYSFLRSIFNTAQLRFYHVLPTLISPVKEVYYGHIHAWTKLHTEVELLWFRKWDHANNTIQPVIEVQEYLSQETW